MDSEVAREISAEIGSAKARFDVPFPVDGETPETRDLANYNLTALREGRQQWDPQSPHAVAVACSKIDVDRIQGVRRPGEIFLVSGRGGRITQGGVSSVGYGLGLSPSLMQVLVHSCTQRGICRSPEFQKLDEWGVRLPVIPYSQTPKLEGIEPIDFKDFGGTIPEEDRAHSRNRLLKILANSPQIKELVASGKLLVGESYYNEKDGTVQWMSFWRSSSSGQQIPAGFLRAIVSGAITQESHLDELHPSLKALNALVLGNKHFAHQFEPPVPTEVVMFGCADSRVSSIVLKAPFGLVEWLRNAGNVFDDPMLPGLRDSLESAERHLRVDYETNGTKYGDPEGFRRRATLVILSHTKCGAVEAALDPTTSHSGGHGDVAPLVDPLRRRLATYMQNHPNPKQSDEHLAEAAQANAIGACIDLVTTDHPDARRIRQMVLDERVILVPARYSLRRGMVQWFRPLTGEHVHRLGAAGQSHRQE